MEAKEAKPLFLALVGSTEKGGGGESATEGT